MKHELMALSPLDGRYANKLKELAPVFSEYSLIYHRLLVEAKWLAHLSSQAEITELQLNPAELKKLDSIIDNFDITAAEKVKEIEATTNHDVKAVEYYLQKQLKTHTNFIHFACTSEDINNIAYALMLKQAKTEILIPNIQDLIGTLNKLGKKYATTAMLARTHGQAATPTTMGKELINFAKRLEIQLQTLKDCPIFAKLNGATGNFNAHYVAYPEVNWPQVSADFIKNLGLSANLYTTQIEPHDQLANMLHSVSRINTILLDLSRDIWHYISIGYFGQKTKAGEIGSSTMPHKVNPIDFENAEGNLGIANALLNHFASKLPVSRLQRDLSDSTVLRNLGSSFAYGLLAYKSLKKGLDKLEIKPDKLAQDLDDNCVVLAEAIQTVMRRYGINNAYEALKDITRGKDVSLDDVRDFIQQLSIPSNAKQRLLNLTPKKYLGNLDTPL